MNPQDEIGEFLRTRRAKLKPEQAGLPVRGGNRRVSGLRREEVALLADVSVEYYARMERGHVGQISESVLDGLSRALQLGEAERDHLADLVSASATTARRRTPRAPAAGDVVRPTVQRMLDLMPTPAVVRNSRFDVLAANALGRALYSPVFDSPEGGRLPNTARFAFLDPAAKVFFADWTEVADNAVAILRTSVGQDPYSRELSELVGVLCTRSEDFRQRWAAHDVRHHRSESKRFHHPLVGALSLDYESMPLTRDHGQSLNVYTAEPGGTDHEALGLLASWTITGAPLE